MKRFANGQFKPTKHFKWIGIIYLMFLGWMLFMGSEYTMNLNLGIFKQEYTYLSPLVIEEEYQLEDFKMEYKIVEPKERIKLKVSHYWPPLGGTNCGNFVDGTCLSNMANGEDWRLGVGNAIACPKELEFGTKIKVLGREWVCKDRGSKITKNGDTYWIDMLIPYSLIGYGEVVVGELL